MQIILNGKSYELSAPASVEALAQQLGLNTKQVAIERNREIVPRSGWGETQLADGDEVEVVRFIGGG